MLHRILRREHREVRAERMALAVHRRGALLHRFEERRLRLGGGAVDLVGEEEVGEQRPGAKAQLAAGRIEHRHADDVRPGSRSGVNWIRPKRTSRHAASARTIRVLPIPGTPSIRAVRPSRAE
jgi:hypothetical protein